MKKYLMDKLDMRLLNASLITTVLTAIIALPAWAGDPFRASNPKSIGPEAQIAFELMFKQGNYSAATKQVNKALRTEASDPLVQGLRASLAYMDQDYLSMQIYANKTRDAAQKLMATDPLRGHLYTSVSYLIEAGFVITTKGIVGGTPEALGLIQKQLNEIKAAQEIDPNDPELNLIKGYMDMLIATVLPLADLEGALTSLRSSSPEYLKWRGIALGYRDAKKNDQALEAVNKALEAAPGNPELNYLKGQILWAKDSLDEAKRQYRLALSKSKQLPPGLTKQINSECTTLTGATCL
jgi:tetratricopeptide (TPR) repeat protein